ncbi:MAG: NAD(P)H-hydrate dehydratase [Erysipelotrichaceae bacterium]|nr:NAD(P)H-hydrate dehydratase [Erysipelotrichaceae bacterium]
MRIGSQLLMQKYDQALLDDGYSIIELVDKASDCLLKHMDKQSYSFLCGPGNNGADGLSLAIKLFLQDKKTNVYIFDDGHKLSLANQYYLNECYKHHIKVTLLNDNNLCQAIDEMQQTQVIIDAMFGFGLNSSPRGLYASIIEQINQLYNQEIIAVDIPTGLDCNSGKPYQSVVFASKTISLTAYKDGFFNPDSRFFTGEVIVEKLDAKDMSDKVGLYSYADKTMMKKIIKERKYDGHKGDYGRVALITGCDDYKGAALLSAKSCVYSGSGVVSVITDDKVIDSLTSYCPEATTMKRPLVFRKEDLLKYQAILIGCGLGLSMDSHRYVVDVLSLTNQPLVIDADALTILASHMELLKDNHRDIILTPHMGEFKRLCEFDDKADILSVAKEFAKEYHVVLVLKGPHTIVTNGYESYRNASGNGAMSIGGMGDVLAGMITSFVGQGYKPIEAALLGVYLHGAAGDKLAKNHYSVIPSKLIEEIPATMYELLYDKG